MDEVRLPKQTVPRTDRRLDYGLYPERQTARALLQFVILYAALYAAFGVLSPFFPAFLKSRHLRSDEIGFVLGTATAVRLIAGPTAGAAADRMQRASDRICCLQHRCCHISVEHCCTSDVLAAVCRYRPMVREYCSGRATHGRARSGGREATARQ